MRSLNLFEFLKFIQHDVANKILVLNSSLLLRYQNIKYMIITIGIMVATGSENINVKLSCAL